MASSVFVVLFLTVISCVRAPDPDFEDHRTTEAVVFNSSSTIRPGLGNGPPGQRPPVHEVYQFYEEGTPEINATADQYVPGYFQWVNECNCPTPRIPVCASNGITYHNPCVFVCKRTEDISCSCIGECGECEHTCEDHPYYAWACPFWAGIGECVKNPQFMRRFCKSSCGDCNLPNCFRTLLMEIRDLFGLCERPS